MNGMELSRQYFSDVAAPRLKSGFPDLYGRLSAGLVGNGSECFGYDDALSRDHDWGVDFFIWVTAGDREAISNLRKWKAALIEEMPPEYPRTRSEYGARIGVMTTGDFYISLIGCPEGPDDIPGWRRIPEENLAMATNGEVFIDNAGAFTATRERLLRYYPEDIRRKKLAARCMAIAQTGQYNLDRCFKRRDWVTYKTVLARFTDSVIGAVFLLNRVFRPYYKWAYRRMTELPVLGGQIGGHLARIARSDGDGGEIFEENKSDIDEICALLVRELQRQRLALSDDWFLTTQGEEIQHSIQDGFLRSLPAQYE
ncbi:protein of unknown function [Sporobacter termitidis DSM 10068]|uniref:DUF4037 domain-containing protein n=1 Tax=Sporobacter termitidis DSM 10068 TaxID=1123282 RepID=A0A1M5TEE1_9FIRM|nr:DUF4037 domain-containing protein [Sporobacter termitidis]SHH49137.1 protein of unknown function [Sporobacter termitidis DSM 10068]